MKKNLCLFCVVFLLIPLSVMGQTLDFERDSTLTDLPYPNLLNILSARVPGFQISPVDCAEGDMSATMTLRGMNTAPQSKSRNNLRANAPLVVVDGMIWYGSISDINTADVAKVEILRDAAALYGARAENGAILITTRQGKTARPQVRFRAAADVSDWSHRPEGVNRTWADIISRRGIGQQYDLSVSGSTQRLSYYVSGEFSRKEGILRGDDYREAAVLARVEYRPLDWLKVGVKGHYTNAAQWGQTPRLQNAFWMGENASEYCTIPGYESWPSQYPDGKTVNPLIGKGNNDSCLYTDRRGHRNDSRATAWAQVDFPFLKGLSFRTSYQLLRSRGGEDVSNDYKMYVNTMDPQSMDNPAMYDNARYNVTASIQYENHDSGDWENELRYETCFGPHHLSLFAGYGREHEHYELRKDMIHKNSSDPIRTNSYYEHWYSNISTGLDYAYGKKLFARLAYRRDQAFWKSQEGPRDSESSGYYQAALAWAPLEDGLKIHASWGGAGFSPDREYYPLSVRKAALGVDFSLWRGRLSGMVEAYDNRSRTSGGIIYAEGSYRVEKNCSVSNRGIEVSLQGIPVPGDGIRSFRWGSDLHLAFNRNRIETLNGKTDEFHVSEAVAYGYDNYYALVAGYPISGIFRYDASTKDVIPAGDGDPSFTLNLGNTFAWMKASLYFNWRWMYGGPDHFLGYDSVAEKWVSRNFLRLSDLVLSYEVNRHVRAFLSGANLVTVTHWPALDPENGGTLAPHASSDRYVSMPTFRTIRLGLNLTF